MIIPYKNPPPYYRNEQGLVEARLNLPLGNQAILHLHSRPAVPTFPDKEQLGMSLGVLEDLK